MSARKKVAGHKRKPPKRKPYSSEVETAARRGDSTPEKAEIFAPQTFKDGSALTPLTAKERDCINTMIDFFRSSGEEEEHLDPDVYEAIATKLGNGREPRTLVEVLDELVGDLRAFSRDTVGVETDGTPTKQSVQRDLWESARLAAKLASEPVVPLDKKMDGAAVADAVGDLLGAIDDVLGADGYDATDCSSCECDEFEQSDKGLSCAHTEARVAQRQMREALREAGYVEDNFGAWGTL